MELQDKVLKCVDCETEFVFTVGQQEFFREKQFRNEPKRCKSCRTKQVSMIRESPRPREFSKVETRTTCSQCGKSATVPFVPSQGRPVLCRDCFAGKRATASA